jgi:NAD(P)-dependent dehydrogenase (short-subunit alcohol dehydrogenase family)
MYNLSDISNAVAPGWIKTNMTTSATAQPLLDWGTQPDRTLMARAGIPEEIADVVVFLCSEEASFVSGALWQIDGGYTAL